MVTTETICALATSNGNASVAVIRLSGQEALSIAQLITRKTLKPRFAHFTEYFDENDQVIDQGLTIYFNSPHSFTGEEVVEFQPHGNPHVCQQIINTTLKHGARLAIAGEFSERAFINGKLDLTQLEAIADLISSGSQQAARSAVQSMRGLFSQEINALLKQIIQVRTHIEASLDFAEEDIETETRNSVITKIKEIKQQILNIFTIAQKGAQLQIGHTVVLTGSPNVGKSSLFNALCAEDRAIVTNIPGTTRDVLSVDIQLNGVPIRLLDTAGIRENAEIVEQEGIDRAHAAIQSADLTVRMFDGSNIELGQEFKQSQNEIIVVNKSDLLKKSTMLPEHVLEISVKTGLGLDKLYDEIQQSLSILSVDQQAPYSARSRHLNALEQCLNRLGSADQQLVSAAPLELAAEECRIAQQNLSEITGEFTPDDLLDYVFREFCIGK